MSDFPTGRPLPNEGQALAAARHAVCRARRRRRLAYVQAGAQTAALVVMVLFLGATAFEMRPYRLGGLEAMTDPETLAMLALAAAGTLAFWIPAARTARNARLEARAAVEAMESRKDGRGK